MGLDLQRKLEEKAKERGAKYFGVADLEPARDFIAEWGGEFLTKFPKAVSIGVRLHDSTVDEIKQHDNPFAITTYWYHVYRMVNPLLDRIGLEIGTILNEVGYKSYVIPSSCIADRKRLTGIFSHKLAAHLAGLGWIGKSALLITPEIGPRLRWMTILTDAPLKAGEPIENRCGDCTICVKACPVKAFTGGSFDTPKPRSEIFDARKCQDYFELREGKIGVQACGMCVFVCPYGRKKKGGSRP
jgi:epoxyqueuosine reductase QueG